MSATSCRGAGENVDMEQHRQVTNPGLDESIDRLVAEFKSWTLKLLLAQTALILAVAAGAVVVAGLLWG